MKKTKLTRYFPMLRTRTEVLEIINRKQHLKTTFLSWNDAEKEQFLSFCTGQRGMKILYDSFLKRYLIQSIQ